MGVFLPGVAFLGLGLALGFLGSFLVPFGGHAPVQNGQMNFSGMDSVVIWPMQAARGSDQGQHTGGRSGSEGARKAVTAVKPVVALLAADDGTLVAGYAGQHARLVALM